MLDLPAMSNVVLDGHTHPTEYGPTKRINHELSVIMDALAMAEA
ncbi:MAG: hypothetical protein QF921_02910 [Pseudomonadales bacterium]|jgi:hypothetical protein|nr:hypothetical protein [Pseudomonadales bacterium]MDP6471187.1 hypothetical protein [Pseudomonadales bacterium]MDP6825626.1 hypothetical protein [Pseudomonadales bacterium]MDP6970459.1 hypothetical protein [Pseudomonadales bacterium]